MRRTPALLLAASRYARLHTTCRLHSEPIIQITNGTFYRQHPSSKSSSGQDAQPNPALFPNLSFSIPSSSDPGEHWAVLSPSSTLRTSFLQILRGQFLCFPPTARHYPYFLSSSFLSSNPKHRSPESGIEYVGFDVERRAFGGAYLSARYESRVESTDFTLGQYLTGITGMNPGEDVIRERTPDEEVMRKVVKDLELERFFDKPVSTLSNGQSRRARIGKALLNGPEVLCLDAPFIGLDPFVSKHISDLLHRLAVARAPRIVLSLRPQDAIPDWITHIVYASEDGTGDAVGERKELVRHLVDELKAAEQGKKPLSHTKLIELREVVRFLSERGESPELGFDNKIPEKVPQNQQKKKTEEVETKSEAKKQEVQDLSRDAYEKYDVAADEGQTRVGEPVVQMEGVRIKYGSSSVLGDWQQDGKDGLWWTVRRGQRWGIFGANGSGKTTLLSLVTSDHPQTYSAPVKLFQRSRLPTPGVPGITIFDIQSLFPKNLSVRRTLETAWSDTPITNPRLDGDAEKRVDACLHWFEAELSPDMKKEHKNLDWAIHFRFGELTFSAQRVLLFLRATIRNPEIVILDEAFSGMDDLVRDKCLMFLSRGESMTLDYDDHGPRPEQSGIAKKGEVLVPGLQEHQALLVVSHSKQEIPGCVRNWICLPESGTGPPRFGKFDGPVEMSQDRWNEIWGMSRREAQTTQS